MADEEEVVEDLPEEEGGDVSAIGDGDGEEENKDGLTQATIKRLGENRKKVQELNNLIKDLRCQEIFGYKNKKIPEVTDEMMVMMKTANCDFLRNFNNMWGMTQDILDGLQVDRIVSTDLSYVPSSTDAFQASCKRSESFENLCSKKLPRVIVCGSDKSEMVPRIIVCEDRDTMVPAGECKTVQNPKNFDSSSLSQAGYTSYGGRFC